MRPFDFHGWRGQVDPDATRRAYALVAKGHADRCGCEGCRRWASMRNTLLPEPVRTLLEQLGIDPAKDAEAYDQGAAADGAIDYGGWWHFVGTLDDLDGAGGDAIGFDEQRGWFTGPSVWTEGDYAPLILYPHTNAALVPPSFAGLPLVQLEFEVHLAASLPPGA